MFLNFKSKNPVVSIDIPSGISSNNGKILGCAIKADFTITFHRKKVGHIMGFGREYSGKVKVADIGFIQKKMKARFLKNPPILWIKSFPWKNFSSHKYSRGRVVVFGGKEELVGATILSSLAALKTGTGSVKIICSKKTLPIYSLKFPSVLKVKIDNLNLLKKLIIKEKNSVFLIGPGAGVNQLTKKRTTSK